MSKTPNVFFPIGITFLILGLTLGIMKDNMAFIGMFVIGISFLAMSFSEEISKEIAEEESEENK